MLKWTASAFAMAAAMQWGVASAQDADVNQTIAAPGAAEVEAGAEDAADAAQDARQEAADANRDAVEDSRENLQDARDDARDAQNDAANDLNANDLNKDLNQNPAQDGVQREARFAPNADGAQVNDHVRSATANLNIDDATRARYRWHNGEWWFKTKSGNWKFYRDNKWQDFDPTTYRAMNSGAYGPGSGNFIPQGDTGYVQPQQFSDSSGYYTQNRPYSTQRYGYRSSNYGGRYNNGWNNNGWNNGYYNNGYNGYGYNNGYGQGYNPGNDRYYGYGPYGQPYSISGDRYRGGVIGSQIGGQLGGQTGAIIGGAIGADAAD